VLYCEGVDFSAQDCFAPAPLDPELEEWLSETPFGTVLKHPLLFSVPYFPPLNRILNSQLAAKRLAVVEAEANEDWSRYLVLYERPWRGEAFAKIADRMSDQQYWNELSWVWLDSENIPENPQLWDRLLRVDRPGRHHLMNDHEKSELEALPDELIIYQGHTTVRDDGWSYTTRRTTAEWFARRFADLETGRPMLTTATVAKADVTAYLLRRGEYEILVDPALVTTTKTTPLR